MRGIGDGQCLGVVTVTENDLAIARIKLLIDTSTLFPEMSKAPLAVTTLEDAMPFPERSKVAPPSMVVAPV